MKMNNKSLKPVDKALKTPSYPKQWWIINGGASKGSPSASLVDSPTEDTCWYSTAGSHSEISTDEANTEVSQYIIKDTVKLAQISTAVQSAFESEATLYQKLLNSKPSGDRKWINDVLQAGTLSGNTH